MNLKKKIFGIPVFLIALLLVVGLGTAALVGYLSNTVTADVTVESPLKHGISKTNGGYGESITFEDIRYGGETITFYTRLENLANGEITGNGINTVTSPPVWDELSGTSKYITCADFKSVVVTTNGDGPYDLIALLFCEDGDTNDNKVVFKYGPNPITWPAKQVDINKIEATFKDDAVGTYTFTSQVVV